MTYFITCTALQQDATTNSCIVYCRPACSDPSHEDNTNIMPLLAVNLFMLRL